MNSEEVILDVKNLSTEFKTSEGVVEAVKDVSFHLKKGEVIGLVGESGCGKSITAMSILQIIPQPPGRIAGGEILYRGTDLRTLSERELRQVRGNRISMIFQDPMTSLNPFMRVSEQIIEPLLVHRQFSRRQARVKAVELMKLVGIKEAESRIDNYPHEFSGGMRQRVMIAMALICEPDILIADEPTTALDVSVQIQIIELIKDLSRRLGNSVIFISHDLGVIAHLCNRVYVMYAGRIIEEAGVKAIFKENFHPYTQGLIDSVAQLHDPNNKGKDLTTIDGQPPVLIRMPDACLFHPRCRHAMDICRQKRPEFVEVGPGHRAACWLSPESVRK